MLFPNFLGNEQSKAILSSLIDSAHFPHAVLIDGPTGVGKKTLARIIAASVVCQSNEERPCSTCRHCRNALNDIHPDIKWFEGDGKSHIFKVDKVREIRLDAFVKPNDGEHKVYILTDIQDMNEQAQNALLKILEEPPKPVVFIMTCDSKSHVLETILSRSQSITVTSISEQEVIEALTSQCKDVSRDDIERVAKICSGNVGQAKLMLHEGFAVIKNFVEAFVEAWCSPKYYSFLKLSAVLLKDSALYKSFLEILPFLIRDGIMIKSSSNHLLSGFDKEAKQLSSHFTLKRLLQAQSATFECLQDYEQSANPTLQTTTLFSRLWSSVHS